MPTGYRVEVAKRGQARCNGPKPCKGSKIDKGILRLGSWVEVMGNGSFKWRHWGCECFGTIAADPARPRLRGRRLNTAGTTDKVIANLKESFEEAKEIDGCRSGRILHTPRMWLITIARRRAPVSSQSRSHAIPWLTYTSEDSQAKLDKAWEVGHGERSATFRIPRG